MKRIITILALLLITNSSYAYDRDIYNTNNRFDNENRIRSWTHEIGNWRIHADRVYNNDNINQNGYLDLHAEQRIHGQWINNNGTGTRDNRTYHTNWSLLPVSQHIDIANAHNDGWTGKSVNVRLPASSHIIRNIVRQVAPGANVGGSGCYGCHIHPINYVQYGQVWLDGGSSGSWGQEQVLTVERQHGFGDRTLNLGTEIDVNISNIDSNIYTSTYNYSVYGYPNSWGNGNVTRTTNENDYKAAILLGAAALVGHKFDNLQARGVHDIIIGTKNEDNTLNLSRALSPVGNLR